EFLKASGKLVGGGRLHYLSVCSRQASCDPLVHSFHRGHREPSSCHRLETLILRQMCEDQLECFLRPPVDCERPRCLFNCPSKTTRTLLLLKRFQTMNGSIKMRVNLIRVQKPHGPFQ